MEASDIRQYIEAVSERWQSLLQQYWFLQLLGWSLFAVVSVLSIVPLVNNRFYVVYRLAFMVAAPACTFMLHPLCKILWKRHVGMVASLCWISFACLPLGFVCSLVASWAEGRLEKMPQPLFWRLALGGATDGWFLLFAWCACYFGLKQYRAHQQHHAARIIAESLARESQLQALRFQLQPHFLFNTLNALSTLVLSRRNDEATQTISRLADFLRATLQYPERHEVMLWEEIEIAEHYLAIERVRFGSRLHVEYEVESVVECVLLPRLLLQPLLENAVRHGIARITWGGDIKVSARKRDQRAEICIRNSVPGGTAQPHSSEISTA